MTTSGKEFNEKNILDKLTEIYGDISEIKDLEDSNNPFAYYYKINDNNLIFSVLSCFDSNIPINNFKKFKTMRINPNGYVSNCVYSPKVYAFQNLNYNEKVDLLENLIKEKKSRKKEWYLKHRNKVKLNIDFWRFGGERIEEAFIFS